MTLSTRLRRRLVLVFGGAFLVGVTACGLTALGEFVGGAPPDADGGQNEGGGGDPPDGASSGPDAGSDAPDPDMLPRCLAGCEAGVCSDAGVCGIDCSASNSCQGGPVRCPPGVVCRIDCGGANSCSQGVDCSAAAGCAIDCLGTDSCSGRVTCSGKGCAVNCAGNASACNQGVSCDAGSCEIACNKNDCQNGLVACYANDCAIKCGADAGGTTGDNACRQGVTCAATSSCRVECLSNGSCQGSPFSIQAGSAAFLHCRGNNACQWAAPVPIVSGGGASVICEDDNACNRELRVSAGDAGITCTDNQDLCTGGISCDGGRCATSCADTTGGASTVELCCRAGACVDAGTNNCTFNDSCP